MEKRISQDDERKLTYAVKTAAMLVNSDPTRDCNKVLAKCLLDNNVDSRFAKVASAAFNKQYTVTRFHETPDDRKIDAFPLSDTDTVLGLMGAAPAMSKSASVKVPGKFNISISYMDEMQKRAAAKPARRKLYEDTVSMEGLVRHVESVMDKQASAHRNLVDIATRMEIAISAGREKLAADMEKLGSFDRALLCNVHADKLNALLGDTGMEFHKTASTGDPCTELSRRIVKLATLVRDHDAIVDGANSLKDALEDFSTGAAMLGNDLNKTAGAAGLGALIRGVTGFGATALQGLEAVREASNDALDAGFSNAAAMNNAVDDGYRPGKVLSSEFLVKDRFRDRMLSWSDMTADPMFAMYPSEQVFLATQKAMDMNRALERPDYREALRTQVGQLLAQNNRASTADVSALAQTLRGLGQAEKGAVMEAAAPVLDADKVTGPDAPATTGLFGLLNKVKLTSSKDYMAEAAKQSKAEYEEEEKRKNEKLEAEALKNKNNPKVTFDGFKGYLGGLKARPELDAQGKFTGNYLIKGRGAVPVDTLLAEYKADTIDLAKNILGA